MLVFTPQCWQIRKHNLDMRSWAHYVSLCSIYFICQKSSHRFLLFLSQLLRISFSLKLRNKKWGSPCSLKRKGAFISLSSLVWGKSLTFCTRTRSCARANDAKIVRSRDAQCRTKESLWGGWTQFLIPVFHSPFSLKPLIPRSPKMAASKLTTQTLVLWCHGNMN